MCLGMATEQAMLDYFAQRFPDYASTVDYVPASKHSYGAAEDDEDCGCPRCKQRFKATPRPGFRAKPLRTRNQQQAYHYGGKKGHCHQGHGHGQGHSHEERKQPAKVASPVQEEKKPKGRTEESIKTVPAAMDPPVVTQVQKHGLEVEWVNPNSKHDCGAKVTRYQVVMRLAEGTPAWAVVYSGKERSYRIPCVVEGCSYQLKVRAENAIGCGNYSPIVTCTTPGSRRPQQLHPAILSNHELAAQKKQRDEEEKRNAEAQKRRQKEEKRRAKEEQAQKEKAVKERKEREEQERRMAELVAYEKMKLQMAKDMEERRLREAIEEEKEILRQSALRKEAAEQKRLQEIAREEVKQAIAEQQRLVEDERRRKEAEQEANRRRSEAAEVARQAQAARDRAAAQQREHAAMALRHVKMLQDDQRGRSNLEQQDYSATLQLLSAAAQAQAQAGDVSAGGETGRQCTATKMLAAFQAARRTYADQRLQLELDVGVAQTLCPLPPAFVSWQQQQQQQLHQQQQQQLQHHQMQKQLNAAPFVPRSSRRQGGWQ